MDKQRRSEIEAALDAITPGQWDRGLQPSKSLPRYVVVTTVGFTTELTLAYCSEFKDAAFIATAPAYVRELLADNARLEAEVQAARERIGELMDMRRG